ncbi:hypothetical protein BJ875DRAFT_358651, partial [Amylocarpus encephaloides]
MKLIALLPLLATAVLAIPSRTSPLLPRTTPATMSIKNLVRNLVDPDVAVYTFVIDYSPYGTQNCTIKDTAKGAGVTGTHGFAALGCLENPSTWRISWGHDTPGDFAVMTVVNVPVQYEAFFGWKSPNQGL